MVKKIRLVLIMSLTVSILVGCTDQGQSLQSTQDITNQEEVSVENSRITFVTPTETLTEVTKGFSSVMYTGDYGFDTFLEQGGANSDAEVVKYLSKNLLWGEQLAFRNSVFGCSTISVQAINGDRLFGRNFDWEPCNALVVQSIPENGYGSISTVNMDFLSGYENILKILPESVSTIAALYAPMDGMNEKGLCVAVLMIQDSATINQNTQKPDLTTTTAVRLLLDKAADVEEAIELLQQYDMNASMGMMVHFALSDTSGQSVVVEYIDNQMIITPTPVVTNFYLSQGDKNGIGTAQSHERYNILMQQLENTPEMTMEEVRDAMDSVSKDNFGEFESTEWSIVYNQTSREAYYYHRENYNEAYVFRIEK